MTTAGAGPRQPGALQPPQAAAWCSNQRAVGARCGQLSPRANSNRLRSCTATAAAAGCWPAAAVAPLPSATRPCLTFAGTALLEPQTARLPLLTVDVRRTPASTNRVAAAGVVPLAPCSTPARPRGWAAATASTRLRRQPMSHRVQRPCVAPSRRRRRQCTASTAAAAWRRVPRAAGRLWRRPAPQPSSATKCSPARRSGRANAAAAPSCA